MMSLSDNFTGAYRFDPTRGQTMNFIALPCDLKAFIIILAFVIGILVFHRLRRKNNMSATNATFLAFLLVCAVGSLVISIRSDTMMLNFLQIAKQRYNHLAGDYKLAEIQEDYALYLKIKPYLNGDYQVLLLPQKPGGDSPQYPLWRAQYILPPYKAKENAPFIIVPDKSASYDPKSQTLHHLNETYLPVTQVYAMQDGRGLYRRIQ